MPENLKEYTAQSPQEAWGYIAADLDKNPDFLQYGVRIHQAGTAIQLVIDIDLGGGFESGISFTTFSAELTTQPDFRFAINDQKLIDGIGKFFGMQDIEIGYEEFDKNIIVKSDNADRVKELFSDAATRKTLRALKNFSFYIEHVDQDKSILVLRIEEGITDQKSLQSLYFAFSQVLANVLA